jgi:DNA-directed RNA polymerase subunit RPC12/RpoP
MCRYAGKTYKSNYACFKCRKSFKQVNPNDILLRIKKDKVFHELNGKSVRKIGQVFTKAERSKLSELVSEIESRPIKCPECGNLMADLGKDFRVPKKTAIKEWKILEGLFKVGKYFYSCGCDGIGYIPQNLNDYKVYLKKALKEYRDYIIFYQDKTELEYPDKLERIKYWSDKMLDVRNEMIKQKFDMN